MLIVNFSLHSSQVTLLYTAKSSPQVGRLCQNANVSEAIIMSNDQIQIKVNPKKLTKLDERYTPSCHKQCNLSYKKPLSVLVGLGTLRNLGAVTTHDLWLYNFYTQQSEKKRTYG